MIGILVKLCTIDNNCKVVLVVPQLSSPITNITKPLSLPSNY